jgi:hypothetical protein
MERSSNSMRVNVKSVGGFGNVQAKSHIKEQHHSILYVSTPDLKKSARRQRHSGPANPHPRLVSNRWVAAGIKAPGFKKACHVRFSGRKCAKICVVVVRIVRRWFWKLTRPAPHRLVRVCEFCITKPCMSLAWASRLVRA